MKHFVKTSLGIILVTVGVILVLLSILNATPRSLQNIAPQLSQGQASGLRELSPRIRCPVVFDQPDQRHEVHCPYLTLPEGVVRVSSQVGTICPYDQTDSEWQCQAFHGLDATPLPSECDVWTATRQESVVVIISCISNGLGGGNLELNIGTPVR